MIAAVIAGIGYFVSVFAFGVAFGTVRELFVEPELGALASVLVELPFILAACWAASQMLIGRVPVLRTIPAALTMGWLAFALLMAMELWLSLWVPGRTTHDWLAQFDETAPLLGLAGQLLAAFIPMVQVLIRIRRGRRPVSLQSENDAIQVEKSHG